MDMRNFWKQFTESVTGSRDETIFRTRTGLTSVFVLTIFIILVVSHLLRSYTILLGDPDDFINYPGSNTPVRLIHGTWLDLVESGIVVNLLMVLIVGVFGWFVIGKLLKPIKEMQESQKLFMADAAHELFTPLSIMKTNTEVALMDGSAISAQTSTETLHVILEEVDRMSNIIKNLMKISSKSQVPFTRVNLSAIAERSINMLKPLATEKNIKIQLLKDDSAVMWGNETALDEMITNFVKNAIQYSHEGGLIKLFVTDNSPTDIEIRVQDWGIGIPGQDLKRIFEPFYRGTFVEHSAVTKGNGLGLSIVQEIVKLHNGTIKAKSSVGKGTTIEVRFSLATT